MKTSILSLLLLVSLFCSAHEGGNFVASDMLATMQPGDKAALLMVHFGTTYDDTRTKTIDAINAKAKEAFPQLEMREAYTSRIVMRRLKARGIEKPSPLEALLKLLGDGYTHVIVQSTNIIEGVEMESLRRDVASVAPFFKEIRVGNPLLYSVEDAEAVVDILGNSKPEKCGPRRTWHLYPKYSYLCHDRLYAESQRIEKLSCRYHRRLPYIRHHASATEG